MVLIRMPNPATNNTCSCNGLWIFQFPESIPGNDRYSPKKQQSIQDRNQDGGLAQTVRIFAFWPYCSHPGGCPGKSQAHDITYIMPGICQQGRGVGHKAKCHLGNDKHHIQTNANGKTPGISDRGIMGMFMCHRVTCLERRFNF